MEKLAPYYKAVAGFIAPGVVTLAYALLVASPGTVTDKEWLLVFASMLGTSGTVYAAPKNRERPYHEANNVNELGRISNGVAILIAVVLAVLFVLFLVNVNHHDGDRERDGARHARTYDESNRVVVTDRDTGWDCPGC